MINASLALKTKANKNVVATQIRGKILVENAKIKAWEADKDAKAKVEIADDNIANMVEKISEMSGSLRRKADKLDAIAATVNK